MRTPLAAAVTLLLALPASAGAQTVYSSLPLQGASRGQTQAVVAGARLALKDSGVPLKYISLDDSTRHVGSWTPVRESHNARRAAISGLAYIGAFNSGASAISLPILNEANVPMISPSNTAVGLTRGGPGANPGEPDKYYPTGVRTYFRLAPNDAVQGGALAAAMRDRGCTAIAQADDYGIYGLGVGVWVRNTAKQLGLNVVARAHIHRHRSYRGLARKLKRAKADCFVYTGITASGGAALFRDVGRALPKAKLFGSDGIGDSGFSRHIPRSVARRTLVSIATLAPEAYPASGQAVLARAGKHDDPYFLYGYEAMRLIADAYAAGARDKGGVLAYLRTVNNRASVLGTYSLDANGDTTTKTYGLYGIRGGFFTWSGVVTAP